MDIGKQIQSLLKEAAVYDGQGLYEESRERYLQSAELIKQHAHDIHHHKKILNSITSRLARLTNSIQRMENETAAYQMPNIVIDVMKRHFTTAQDPEQAALDGALALAEFGQYESALEEFTKLLKSPSARLEASKNIIRCHLAKGRSKEAAALFRRWQNSGFMEADETAELRRYIEEQPQCPELDLDMPSAAAKEPPAAPDGESRPAPLMKRHGQQLMDFSTLSMRVPGGGRRHLLREFEIVSQSGEVMRVLIPDEESALADGLKPGTVLDQVQCFSTNAMFSGKATVVENTRISSGADAGHFSVDIQIQGI